MKKLVKSLSKGCWGKFSKMIKSCFNIWFILIYNKAETYEVLSVYSQQVPDFENKQKNPKPPT